MLREPRITVGVPIFNAERYLDRTLQALRAQSLAEFELLIADNGSTDGSREIVDRHARLDSRIRFVPSSENRGAAWNFNRLVDEARGTYFRWHAHDDLCEPDLLRRFVEVLDGDPSVVLVYSRSVSIDSMGNHKGERPYPVDPCGSRPSDRFRELLRSGQGSPPIFGLTRTDILRQTARLGAYAGSDLVLLAELALWGRFVCVDEPLFLHREHDDRSVRANPSRHLMNAWFDPQNRNRVVFPLWRRLQAFASAIRRAPLDRRERRRCWVHLLGWTNRYRRGLVEDLELALRQVVKAVIAMTPRTGPRAATGERRQ